MKKMITRIAACSLAVLIAFNTFAIPRSKAVVTESVVVGFAPAVLAAYMKASGVTMAASTAAGAAAGSASLISGYAAATGGTYSVVTTALASGVTIGTGGVIIIGVAAAALLAAIVAWAVKEYGIKDSPDSVPVYSSSPTGFYMPDGSFYEFSQIVYTVGEPYVVLGTGHFGYSTIILEQTSTDVKKIECFSSSNRRGFNKLVWIDAPSSTVKYEADVGIANYIIRDDVNQEWIFAAVEQDSYGYYRLHDTFVRRLSYADFPWIDEFFGIQPANVTIAPDPDYAPLPELAPLEQIEIQPNLAPEIAPEAVPDAILGKIASGDFAPSYRVIPVTNPNPEPEPEPEPEPDPNVGIDLSGILEWLKRIWDAIKAIPQSIAEAVKNIFVPDAALTTQITDAFAAKFSFVPTLHRLGTDLLSIGPDSKPPVVYIHLEDAEGSIDYGGTVKALDMSWYQRYKEDGDRIIGGFLWLGFLWLLFKRVPAIINGSEMVQEYTADIDRGSKRRKH